MLQRDENSEYRPRHARDDDDDDDDYAPEPPISYRSRQLPGRVESAIQAVGLGKKYPRAGGEVHAVRGVDLTVNYGEIFGMLGPNGAGKSTTIGMLTTMVVPTSGRAWICGMDVARNPVEVKRRIGVVSQNNTLDNELTILENLEFRARYFGMRHSDARQRAMELLEMVNLTDRQKAKGYQMSGGQAQRVMICRALVHRPEVLFLDEPTVALDPQTRVQLWDLLRQLQAGGQTILITTHHMEEVEELCERLAIIDHGKLLVDGTVAGLKTHAGGDTVITVNYSGTVPASIDLFRTRRGVSKVEITGRQVRVFTREPNGVLSDLVSAGLEVGVRITDAAETPPTLQSAFLNLTGREYRE
jgi:ABC-2 type transport system ATP-binding protein